MSYAKELLEKTEEYESIAKDILAEMKAIKFCFCGRTYYDTGKYDKSEIFGLATHILKEKYGEEQDFKLFDNVLEKVFKECGYESSCPNCSNDD